uniref:Copper transport protein n=1 Tax=Populus davidiana TaxID=266767 RepID=A0A6M2EQ96_9ROSI
MDPDHHLPGMSPPPSTPMNGTDGMHHKMMMHMTFFWGKETLILFSGWPGTSTGMYVLALVFVFVLAVLVEWLSHCRLVKPGSRNVAAGLIQALVHAVRVGLAYMVMLAVMSFNGGVFIVAVAGHLVGFLIFGSRVFKDTETTPYHKSFELPPTSN